MSMDSDGWNAGPATDGDTTVMGDTTTENIGFFERLWQSITGILIGFGLIAAVIWGIFWNEGRAIGTTRALNEGAGVTVSVPSAQIQPGNEGKLIHTTGTLSGSPLADADFQVRAQAVRLVRKVEMYQWKEEQRTENRSNAGGSQTRTTTYSYTRVWSDRPISSQNFRQRDGHQNPAMPVTGRSEASPDARLGAFRADSRVIALFGSSAERRLDLRDEQLAPFNNRFGGRARLNDGGVFIGYDPSNPAVGDIRITYSVLPEGPASVVARQNGDGLGPYTASNGRQVFLAEPGTRTAQELYADAHETNRIITWVLRGVGLFLMWLGFYLILRPFVVLADIIPIFGSAMAAGAGLVATALTLVVYLPVVALAWFWHRPVLSVALLVVGFGGAFALRQLGAQRRAARAAAPPVPQAYETAPAYPPQAQPAYGYPQQTVGYEQPPGGYAPQAYPPQAYPPHAQPAPSSFLDVPQSLRPKQNG